MHQCDSRQPDALEDAKRAVCKSLDEVRAEVRRLQRRATTRAKAWALSIQMQHVTLIAFVLSEYNVQPCVHYLRACGRERHWPAPSDDELATLVEHIFLHAELDHIAALSDTIDPSDIDALNIPCTEALLQQAEAARLCFPACVRPPNVGSIGEKRAKRWARRLRDRWGGRYGSVPAPECVEPENLCAKVRDCHTSVSIFGRHVCAQTVCFGIASRALFATHLAIINSRSVFDV
jgi:hypothetical protein